jgi:hypothetical protein
MLNVLEQKVRFPEFSGVRCLMMPYIQGDPASVPEAYAPYKSILESVFLCKGDIGFLTIDESPVAQGQPHRGYRARYGRALHTEAGREPVKYYCWGDTKWGDSHRVTLDRGVRILLANNLDNSCAVWNAVHEDTSADGDIGYAAAEYPYADAVLMKAEDLCQIGILTPHESLPATQDFNRQFLRIVSSGVHGREEYFTKNPFVPFA